MPGLIAALLTALLLGACGSGARTFSESDSVLRVEAGERFRIEIEASPGVGDGWEVIGEPDAAVARFLDSGFESDDPDAVGGSGVIWFEFEAVAAGTTEIVLEYCYRGCGGEGEELEHPERFDVIVG